MVSSRMCWLGLAASLLSLGSASGPGVAFADAPGKGTPAAAPAGPEAGFIPAFAHPNGAVTERQLSELGTHLSQQLGSQTTRPIEVQHPFAPVNRLRALVALVKLGLVGDGPVSAQVAAEKLPGDAAAIPAWGAPYVAAAVEQGWWPNDRPLQPQEVATWTFVKVVLARMLSSSPSDAGQMVPAPAKSGDSAAPADDGSAAVVYTGLVLDARGLDLQRTMGPRIVDEDGQLLYPDPTHVPDMTFLQDHGMAAYVIGEGETPRSGSHPLVVTPLSASGPAHEDLVISRETARQIRDADAHGGFLSRWAVSILLGAR